MSAKVTQAPSSSPATPQAQINEADASCPVGMLALFAGAAVWLALALVCALRADLNFHSPKLLAGVSYLTYGRVLAAGNALLLYGFCVPTVLGLGIWLLSRLGKTQVALPAIITIGAILWHSAVAIGAAAILCGRSTGYDYFEIPGWCARLMFLSYCMVGVGALMTFHSRKAAPLYPSQWFVLGALFWFPWIFSTGMLVLQVIPARGILQATSAWWYARNFDTVFLGFGGLALTFYFIPKILNRPLASHYMAAFGFWTLALFGSCGGIPNGAPVPAWMSGLSMVGTILMTVPILSIVTNLYSTVKRDTGNLDGDPTLRFVYIGLVFWLIAGFQQIVGVLPDVSALTDFTWFGASQKYLMHYGFFAMTAYGALYYVVPQIVGLDRRAWCAKLMAGHFWLTFLGLLFSYLPMVVAGIGQGIMLADANRTFAEVMRGSLIPLRFVVMGDLAILLGTLMFILNFGNVLRKACRSCCAEGKGAA